jgi:hypothetical protein
MKGPIGWSEPSCIPLLRPLNLAGPAKKATSWSHAKER